MPIVTEHDIDCVRSTVKNTSGTTRRFTFLDHGVVLAAGEEKVFPGNVFEMVARKDGKHSRRNQNAFMLALDAGVIEIVSLPRPILVDETTGDTKQLRLNNNTVTVEDPCWTDSSDSDEL